MKLFVLSDELSGTGPVWMNIFWPHYTAYAACVPTVMMSTPFQVGASGRLNFYLQNRREQREYSPRLCDLVRREKDPKGPNVLIVWALNIRDIIRSQLLDPVWDTFDHKVLWILDTINPAHIKPDHLKRFDVIASICGDIGRELTEVTDRPVLYMPPHTDVLTFGTTSAYRPLDLLVIGRRDRAVYDPIHFHFNAAGRDRISVDLMTRTSNFSGSAEEECQILMGAYARAKIAFCFEPSGAHPRFRGYSPLTERWPHAWASGCTVVGTRPTGQGAAEQMDWPEATIELPEAPEEAIAFVTELLDDPVGLERRRNLNFAEVARRHDSRYRLQKLLTTLDIPFPEGLVEGLAKLDQIATRILKETA